MPEATRILVPVTGGALGGSELTVLRLLDRIDRGRFSFSAWIFGEGPLADELRRRGVGVSVWPRSSLRTPWGLLALARALRRERPDVVFLHSSRLIAWCARRAGVPCVEMINLPRVRGAGGWCRFAAVDRFFTSLNTRVVAVSEYLASQLAGRGVPREKIVVIRVLVDTERFGRAELRDESRRELGVAPGEVLVLNVGRLSREKAQRDLVRTAARCVLEEPSLRFVIAGEGPERAAIEAESRGLGLGTKLLMPGFSPHVERLYSAADIYLHTSLYEALPNAVVEAMASGLPVVATDVGGTREAVTSPEVGRLVAAGDVEATAREVLDLARDGELRASIGRAARERALAEFSPERTVGRFEELFEELARGRAKAR